MFKKRELLYSQVTINIHKNPKPIQRLRNTWAVFLPDTFSPQMVYDSHQQIVQQRCHAQPVWVPRINTSWSSPLFLSHIHLQPTPHHPVAQTSGHLHWKLPLIQPNCHNLMPSNVPALVSKCNICLRVLTSDLIIDFKESIEKSFLNFIFCCWIQTTSPDIYPLISMNNGKLWETTWSFIQSEVRPKPKLNTPQHFWRLYSDVGFGFTSPVNWFCTQDC